MSAVHVTASRHGCSYIVASMQRTDDWLIMKGRMYFIVVTHAHQNVLLFNEVDCFTIFAPHFSNIVVLVGVFC